jgi:hypothetical protein
MPAGDNFNLKVRDCLDIVKTNLPLHSGLNKYIASHLATGPQQSAVRCRITTSKDRES